MMIIIHASNSHTRIIELEHIDSWAKLNNLTLNGARTVEVIFADKNSKAYCHPIVTPVWHYTMHYTQNFWSRNYQWPVNG